MRERLDRWHPTVVRYLGIGTAVYALFVRDANLLPLVFGLLLYKTVIGKGDRE